MPIKLARRKDDPKPSPLARPAFWWILGGAVAAFLIFRRKDVEQLANEAVEATSEAISAAVTWAQTNDRTIDAEIGPRVTALAAQYIPESTQSPAIVRALMAIVNNEYARYLPATGQVGDMSLSGGPSVGPMQVYRRTAIDMGFVPKNISKQDYAAYAADLDTVLKWGVLVFKEKLRMAHGNVSLAIKYYNGSGAQADDYRAKALAFIQRIWGSLDS
jgi:hypothetical protein